MADGLPEKRIGKQLQGGFVILLVGLGTYACVNSALKEQGSAESFLWHYRGPESKAPLVRQAVDVLVDVCPRIAVYHDYIEKPDVVWHDGFPASIKVTTRFKQQPISPEPGISFPSNDHFDSRDVATIVMTGPPVKGILIYGRAGMWICEVSNPPIGTAPALMHEERLAGLTP